MKRLVLLSLASALLLSTFAAPTAASAEEPQRLKPMAVVAIAGYDGMKEHVAFAGALMDNPNLAIGLEAMLKLVTKNRGLEGLDKARPFGVAVVADGAEPAGYAFVPVTHLPKLLDALESFLGKPEEVAPGTYRIQTEEKPLFVTEATTGWAVVADSQALLGRFSGHPGEMIAGLNEHYDVALRIQAANVPDHFRSAFIQQLRLGAEHDAARREHETTEQYAVRRQVTEMLVANLTQVVADLDAVTVGLKLDHPSRTAAIEATLTFNPGSPMAQAAEALRDGRSRFAGFRMAGAALWTAWTGEMPQVKADALGAVLTNVRAAILKDLEGQKKPEEERAFAEQTVNELFDMLVATVASRRVDGGAAVLLDPAAATLVAGMHTADPSAIEKTMRDVAGIVAWEHPVLAKGIRLDAETFEGVRLHTISLPVPHDADNREKVVRLVGETLDVVVGFAEHGVYLAAGRDALETLKRAIGQSVAETERDLSTFEMTVSLDRVVEFIAVMGEEKDRPKARRIAEELAATPEKNHLRAVGRSIPRGVRYRIVLEEGLLRLLPKLQAIEQGQ